ncbi:MAG: cobalamin B12-binding domain-containing protein [Candidatus Eisenbacteria bacterium]
MDKRHPIRVVETRTGIPGHLLRAWERRYAAVRPFRTPSGRRLYTEEDVERLRLLKRVIEAGRRISDVATLSRSELDAIVRDDQDASARLGGKAASGNRAAGGYLGSALAAVEAFDEKRLQEILGEASVALGSTLLRRTLIVPLMREIGERWREGTLRVMHEHMASAIVRSYLGITHRANQLPEAAPRIVLATPAGQLHELGALLAAEEAHDVGWRSFYLGPNLPAEEIVAAVRAKEVRAVGLGIVYPPNDPLLPEQLRSLRRFAGPELAILVGGMATGAYGEVLREVEAIVVEDLDRFQKELERLAR